jgi:hypothetical protein
MLLAVDRTDDFRDNVIPSSACSQDGRSPETRDLSDEEPDEVDLWLRCLSRTDVLFIGWLRARMCAGEGEASTERSMRWVALLVSGWGRGCFGFGEPSESIDAFLAALIFWCVSRSKVYTGATMETPHRLMV